MELLQYLSLIHIFTGCTEHKELGTSSDGKYKYYLSTNKDADADLLKDVEGIEVTLTEMTPFQMLSAFDQPQDTSDSTEAVSYTHLDMYKRQLFLFPDISTPDCGYLRNRK